jgi:hypothetical protein
MQFFGPKDDTPMTIRGDEKKLLLVFTDNSGSVDVKRGAMRRTFYKIVIDFFSQLSASYDKRKSSLAVYTFVFDNKTAQMDRYHWVGKKQQNSTFIVKYPKIPRKKTYGTSINEVYKTALKKIEEHATSSGGYNFQTYIMVVCDGATEDYRGAPSLNVWRRQMKKYVTDLKAKGVTFLLVGAADLDPNDRPTLPGVGESHGDFYLSIHEEMWANYTKARGFYGDNTQVSVTDINWFVRQLS